MRTNRFIRSAVIVADRDDGMSELANFAVVVMQVQEYGPEAYGTTIPRSGSE